MKLLEEPKIPRSVSKWRLENPDLNTLFLNDLRTKKPRIRAVGGGAKPKYQEMEVELFEWILSLDKWKVTKSRIIQKAAEIAKKSHQNIEFGGSKCWFSSFRKRFGIEYDDYFKVYKVTDKVKVDHSYDDDDDTNEPSNEDIFENNFEPSSIPKRNKYTLDFKLEAIEQAKIIGVTKVGRIYNIDKDLIHEWRRKESMIRDSLTYAKNAGKFKMRISGGGRRRNVENVELELKLCQWMLESKEKNVQLTRSLILNKAKALFLDEGRRKDFNLSRNWFVAFAQRYDLQHDHVTDSYWLPHFPELKVEEQENSSAFEEFGKIDTKNDLFAVNNEQGFNDFENDMEIADVQDENDFQNDVIVVNDEVLYHPPEPHPDDDVFLSQDALEVELNEGENDLFTSNHQIHEIPSLKQKIRENNDKSPGRKVVNVELEKKLFEWILMRYKNNWKVNRKLIQMKAIEIASLAGAENNENSTTFKASSNWAFNFMKRYDLLYNTTAADSRIPWEIVPTFHIAESLEITEKDENEDEYFEILYPSTKR